MVSRKKHLDAARFFTDEKFKSKRLGRNPGIPGRNRKQHGNFLKAQFTSLLDSYALRKAQGIDVITEELGIYVEIISIEGYKLPLDSLDNKDFKLCSCKKRDNCEIALVFIPDNRRETFLKKYSNI